jgi:parallel beta-helix repeat protein
MDKTILSFRGQKTGSAGFQATSNGFTMENLAIEDTKGDALKINNATGVTVRRVRTEWTVGPNAANGAYGIYPVQCKNVLVEDSVAIAAADAGIYIGQSQNIVLRRNRAERNVVGIEVENSQRADVYENVATGNTGGMLIITLPNLPVLDGREVRVHDNQITANNLANFAPKGALVANVAAGTGLMVMAVSRVEVFKNKITDHASYNVGVNSYLVTKIPIKDQKYYPYTEAVYVHDNVIAGGGEKPDARVARDIEPKLGKPIPWILYDGVVDPKKKTLQGESRICFQNNGDVTFANYDLTGGFKKIVRDAKAHDCSIAPVAPVELPGAGASVGN